MSDWDRLDGYYLLKGIDLAEVISNLPADRAMSVLESVFFEEAAKDLQYEDDRRTLLKSHLRVLKKGGTMSMDDYAGDRPHDLRPSHSAGRTTSNPRQPPKYIQPTDQGYPGLEAPLG